LQNRVYICSHYKQLIESQTALLSDYLNPIYYMLAKS